MPCFVPFDSEKLDVSFFAFRPMCVLADELIDVLKYFSFHAEDLGCLYSSIFQSIHGNLVVWYGAWIKRSDENRKILYHTLLSALDKVSGMAVVLRRGFFEAFHGESKEGHDRCHMAKFFAGDTVTLSAMVSAAADTSELSYACLAFTRSYFPTIDGATAGVCLRSHDERAVATLLVWKSLQDCYAWLFSSDYRKTILPYFSELSDDSKFDIFKVVYVSRDEFLGIQPLQSRTIKN